MLSEVASAPAPSRLEHLTPAQRERLALLARARQAGSRGTLHGKFEEWALRTPDAIAISCGAEHLSYGELDQRAAALARRLAALGLERGELVAITLDRGVALVVAILAVLKAGAAYVPIDPAVPGERQRFIRADAGARFTLSESRYRALLEGCSGQLLMVDLPEPPGAAAAAVLAAAAPGDLAYVIYTSGSTGKPKGVMVEHRNVVRLFSASERHFAFSERDVWTLFHSYAFDFSVWELWGALLYGARLVIVPYAVARAPAELAELILAEGVTVLNQTPTAFSNLMPELLAGGSPGALRYIVFGGEALEPKRLARWFERFGDSTPLLVNMYGITETTVHVTYKALSAADGQAGVSDIGSPLCDLALYLLDEQRRQVEQGATGELYVSGAGVSRGYLNRPELTAERFIDSPFAAGERLYKTGDLARRGPGGVLEYLGRNDDQVKLRGFRIELGDIERCLLAHGAVRDALVAVSGEGDERQLAAYLVPAAGQDGDWRAELHSHLAAQLPAYMIPTLLVVLDALPTTSNGKIDRAALPAPAPGARWSGAVRA